MKSAQQLSITKDDAPDFVTVLAHEVRNPLTNIKLSVDIIAAKSTDEDLRKYLDVISRNTERIDSLIKDLLKNTFEYNYVAEVCSVHQLLDEVLQMVDDRIKLRGVDVLKKYAMEDIKTALNKDQVKIALTNIIVNAIEAMAPQKGKLKLVTKSAGSKYSLQIEDNGCGIKKENLDHIFKPYFTDKPDGLGVGLTATQSILRSNHVEIKVKSKVGAGTCFTLMFHKNHINGLNRSWVFQPVHPVILNFLKKRWG